MFLVKISPKIFVIKGGFTNTIAYMVNKKIILIDPGISYEFINRIRQKVIVGDKKIEEEDIKIFNKHAQELLELIKGYDISSILISHTHLDHFGVSRILKDSVYSSVIQNFQVADIYGEEYLRDFIIGECKIKNLLEVNLETIKVIPLPGHDPNLVGFLFDENIFFVSDALPSELEWAAGIPFLKSAKKVFQTLKEIENLNFEYLILSHSPKKTTLNKMESKELIKYNRERIESVCEFISTNYLEPEEIIFNFAKKFGINIQSPITHHLLKTALLGYYDLAYEYLRMR